MKHPENWVLRFYALLLALHPPLFRIEFGEEMLAVFSEALSEVRRQGWLSVLNWCRQEFSSLFALLIRERWLNLRGEKAIMNQMLEENQLDDFDEMGVRTTVTRKEILAAILPFILVGSMFVLKGVDYHVSRPPGPSWPISRFWQLAVLAGLLVGLGVGWARNFPRWSYAYLGAVLTTSYALATTRMVGLVLFGYTFGAERLGWRGWAPLLLLTLLMLLLTRSTRPLARLFEGMLHDWTQLSFALYATVCWMILAVTYDGKTWYLQTQYLPLNLFLITLVFAGGAFLYMRVHRPWPRALVLLAALFLHGLPSSAVTPPSANSVSGSPPSAGWLILALVWLLWSSIPLFPGLARQAWIRIRPT